jgi:hypothetical protein
MLTILFLSFSTLVQFEVREEAVGIGQSDSIAKYGIGESIGRSGEVLEDDYGIAVKPERFTDIVSGVDPSKFTGGSGRIGEEVMRRGFGFGAGGGPGGKGTGGGTGGNGNDVSIRLALEMCFLENCRDFADIAISGSTTTNKRMKSGTWRMKWMNKQWRQLTYPRGQGSFEDETAGHQQR